MATKDAWSVYVHVRIWMWMFLLFVLVSEEINKSIHKKEQVTYKNANALPCGLIYTSLMIKIVFLCA